MLKSFVFWRSNIARHSLINELINRLNAKEINHVLNLFRVIADMAIDLWYNKDHKFKHEV